MKPLQSKMFWVTATIVLTLGYMVSCTKNNQVLNTAGSVTVNGTDLLSYKTATAPTIDGTIDALWDKAEKLNFTLTVPDPGNGLFYGYIGDSYPLTLRSMYDDQYIYFLAEYADKDKNWKIAPWYFNPTTKLWALENKSRLYDVNGVLTREGFGEDKLAMLWNVGNSTAKFTAQTCYASCHVFTPYLNYAVTPPAMKSNANSGNHYTNGANEKIDMWWGHPLRGMMYGKMDDNYQDWAGGPNVTSLVGGAGNGRHFDDLVVSGTSTTWPNAPTYTSDATQGSVANSQTLKLDGTGASVTVPKYIIPNGTNEYITIADTASGLAKLVTGVSSTGVLTYNGGTVDPNVGTDYLRTGDPVYGGVGAKCVPGNIISPVLRGRADIDLKAVYTGTGWVYEYKRLLKTADVLNQDIDFSGLKDEPFGIAIWNKNNNQHAIKPNLLLKFQK